MPREKPLFRANLDRLDEAYPGRELLKYSEVAEYLGVSTKTVQRNFSNAKAKNNWISKTRVADFLCQE